ncbi:MAG: HEAT repeat domain-containing protein [Deltaproteobacteria bacterium]|nr:HEAT repeat domain-containing protein [Deltaproteobacteria bacterium]
MVNEYTDRTGFWGGVAKVLNAGGSATVYTYDATATALGKFFSVIKKAPSLPGKAKGIFTVGLGGIRPGEIKILEAKIKDYENKIKVLYYEIGKEGAKSEAADAAMAHESVTQLISDVREYEKEIQRLQKRIEEVKEQREAAASVKKKHQEDVASAKESERMSEEQILTGVASAIKRSIKEGLFESVSDRAVFERVANDLLDSETEIKILAAAELGKMGNQAAVPIFMEAVKFDNPALVSEIINSLIGIGDARAISLFKKMIYHPSYQVRIGCLRGLYKLAGSDDAGPLLIESLRDKHPEVRRTAITFIGWKDYADATPGLIQCLKDGEPRVRKAAVSALANLKDKAAVLPLIKLLSEKEIEIREKALDAIRLITGEEIVCDVHASGKALAESIDNLRDWWQEKRMGDQEPAAMESSLVEPDLLQPSEEVEPGVGEVAEPLETASAAAIETTEEIEAAEVTEPESQPEALADAETEYESEAEPEESVSPAAEELSDSEPSTVASDDLEEEAVSSQPAEELESPSESPELTPAEITETKPEKVQAETEEAEEDDGYITR